MERRGQEVQAAQGEAQILPVEDDTADAAPGGGLAGFSEQRPEFFGIAGFGIGRQVVEDEVARLTAGLQGVAAQQTAPHEVAERHREPDGKTAG